MPHPTPELLAQYLDGVLDRPEKDEVEAHLTECGECRAEVRDAARALRERGAPGRRRYGYLASTLAAAGIAAVLLVPGVRPTGEPPTDLPRFRSPTAAAPAERPTQILASQPRVRSEGGTPEVTLAWAGSDGATDFVFTLTDDAGETLWTTTLADTTLVIPGDAGLEGGRTYFWFVDATLPDGAPASTGVQEFRIP